MKRLFAIYSCLILGSLVASIAVAADANVGSQPAIVNHLTMNQWVRASDDGQLSGRVFLPSTDGQSKAIANVNVAMVAEDGKVFRGKTDAKGVFEVNGVASGVYALTARGDDMFACCALHVVDKSMSADVELPTEAEIAVANVDYTVVNTAMIRYMPVGSSPSSVTIADAQIDQLQDRIRSEDSFRVIQTDGGMKGRIHLAGARKNRLSDAHLTNVFLFKGGMEIDRALTDDAGHFEFKNIAAGNYSVMAIGPDGIGLIGFELVTREAAAKTASRVGADGTQLVGFGLFGHGKHHGQTQCPCQCEEFAVQVAPCPQVVTCVEEVVEEVIVSEPIVDAGCGCGVPGEVIDGELVMDGFGTPLAGGGYVPGYGGGGGYGGGYGGGGGGFGGGFGGGIGGLAALGALGAVFAATQDDDNNNAIVAPIDVVSPSSPN